VKYTKVTLGIVLAMLLSTSFLQAETRKIVRATVPFEFSVSGKTLPAGEYLISLNSPNTMALETSGGGSQVLAIGTSAWNQDRQAPKLVFWHEGPSYVLSQVWFENGDGHVLLARSKKGKAAQSQDEIAVVQAK
jgi:hypothetical protein